MHVPDERPEASSPVDRGVARAVRGCRHPARRPGQSNTKNYHESHGCKRPHTLSFEESSSGVVAGEFVENHVPSANHIVHDLNDGCNEAMRAQLELQKSLHEQLEVQQHLHLRIGAQVKYLHSILERACIAIINPNHMGIQLDFSKTDISDLHSIESKACLSFVGETLKPPSISNITISCPEENSTNRMAEIAERSVDSCLTSIGSPGGTPFLASEDILKKRLCPLLGEFDLQPKGAIQQDVHWMSSI